MARIRTVKPTFWSHPITGKLSDAAKCMALALLNLADDEGYFYADPATVRSFCRPFDDDSTITRGCISELSRVGYLQIKEHPERGPVGRITSFLEHQRIDRANKSEIKAYFIVDDSTKARRLFDVGREGSGREEEEGRGGEVPPDSDRIVLTIAQAYPECTYENEFQISGAEADAIIYAIDQEAGDYEKVLAGTKRYAESITNPNMVMAMDKFFRKLQHRRTWTSGDTKPSRTESLLRSVSEISS